MQLGRLTKTKTSRNQYFLIRFFIDQSLSFEGGCELLKREFLGNWPFYGREWGRAKFLSRDPIKTQNREAEAAAKIFILPNNNIPESLFRSSVLKKYWYLNINEINAAAFEVP